MKSLLANWLCRIFSIFSSIVWGDMWSSICSRLDWLSNCTVCKWLKLKHTNTHFLHRLLAWWLNMLVLIEANESTLDSSLWQCANGCLIKAERDKERLKGDVIAKDVLVSSNVQNLQVKPWNKRFDVYACICYFCDTLSDNQDIKVRTRARTEGRNISCVLINLLVWRHLHFEVTSHQDDP